MRGGFNRQGSRKIGMDTVIRLVTSKNAGIVAVILLIAAFVIASLSNSGPLYAKDKKTPDCLQAKTSADPDPQSLADILHRFGYSVSGGYDLDGDAVPDWIVGAPYLDHNGSNRGRVFLFSGVDSSLIYVLDGAAAGDEFGFSVASVGDTDDDGLNDFLVSAPGNSSSKGKVYLFSAIPCNTLCIFDGEVAGDLFGFSVSGAGDVNNDGKMDMIVGAPGANNGKGRIYVYLGGTCYLKFWDEGEQNDDRLGHAVSGVGDFDDDGNDDVVVGAPYYDGVAKTDNGRIYVLSGASSGSSVDLLCWEFGAASYAYFGWSLADAGDVDNNGDQDFIVGSPGRFSDRGAAYILTCDGPDLNSLCDTVKAFFGETSGDRFGHAVAGGCDVDNDTEPDVIIGAPNANSNTGKVYVYLCDEWILHCSISGEEQGDRFGYAVSCIGDIDDDDCDDFVIGAIYADCTPPPTVLSSGKVYVYSGYECSLIYKYGIPCFCGDPWGDLNCDGNLNPVDVVFIVNYVYLGNDIRCYPEGWCCPYDLGDVNCDCAINPVDVTLYINCVYGGDCITGWCDDPCE